MKIALPTENGKIYPHLGKATEFTLATVSDDGKSFSSALIAAPGDGHIGAVNLLASVQADVLICGELGLMARSALQMMELTLVPGCTGDAATAVQQFLAHEAQGDPAILAVEIEMDENDPMQCMHDCSKCGGCGDTEMLEALREHLPKA